MATKNTDIEIRIEDKKDILSTKTFKLEQFVMDPEIIKISKRGSGRSWVIRELLEFSKDIPAGVIIYW